MVVNHMEIYLAECAESAEAVLPRRARVAMTLCKNVGSKTTYWCFSKSYSSSETAKRFTADIVIPGKPAISAPE